jgi:hypothetical protein
MLLIAAFPLSAPCACGASTDAEHPRHGEVTGGAGGTGVRHFRAADCEGPGERSGAQVFKGVWPSPLLLGLRVPSLPSLFWH